MPGTCAAAQTPGPNVLVISSSSRLLPGFVEFDRGLGGGDGDTARNPPRFFVEFLDAPEFGAEAYEAKAVAYLKEKYATRPPKVIVSAGNSALPLLLRHRAEMFPGVPIVHASVERAFLNGLALPADVIGVPVEYDIRGTLELALHLHPGANRLVIVTGAGRWDRERQAAIRAVVENRHLELPVEYLEGRPGSEVAARLAQLTPDTIVLTPGYFDDGTGRTTTPRESVVMMAAASAAPLYVLFSSQIGAGAVGGRVASFVEMGRQARMMVNRLLEGVPPSSIVAPPMIPTQVNVDWRQIRRWNIAADSIPSEATIQFREPTLWEAHRTQVIVAGAVLALQGAWIIALLLSRRKLRQVQVSLNHEYEHRVDAERLAEKLRTYLSAAEKQSSLGALTAGIAHEIGQPLISVKNYAQAAKRYLTPDSPHREKLGELLAEMESEAGRAGAIIQRIRNLLASCRVEAVAVPLGSTLEEVLSAMKPELDGHHCRVVYRPSASAPQVLVDPLQIQLVMVNLIRNAVEAMDSATPVDKRVVTVEFREDDERMVEVSVADTGPGVRPDEEDDIFESLYSTKVAGMGIGLATCRTIVEAHGGRVRYTSNPAGGATLRFTVPIAVPSG